MGIWKLESNIIFFVRSFYKFLIDGRMCSDLYLQFWKVHCRSKISLFCWLVSDDKILTLSNLAKKGCNLQQASDTCVLYHKDSKTTDHLLLKCEFTERVLVLLEQVLNLYSHPKSLSKVWTSWIPALDILHRILWDLISRAICWNIWLERNNLNFQFHFPAFIHYYC